MATENKSLLTLAFIPRYSGLTIVERCILYAFSRYVNQETGTFWPSLSSIAKDVHLTTRAVRENVSRLKARGYLKEHGRRPIDKGFTFEYSMRRPEFIEKHMGGTGVPRRNGHVTREERGRQDGRNRGSYKLSIRELYKEPASRFEAQAIGDKE